MDWAWSLSTRVLMVSPHCSAASTSSWIES